VPLSSEISKITTPIVEGLKGHPVLLTVLVFMALVIGMMFWSQREMRDMQVELYRQHGELTKLMFTGFQNCRAP